MVVDISFYRSSFNREYTASQDVVTALQKLKHLGASITDAVRVVKYELELPLKEADEVVLSSGVWNEYQDNSIKARETFWDFIEKEPGANTTATD